MGKKTTRKIEKKQLTILGYHDEKKTKFIYQTKTLSYKKKPRET
jgi:hypothetical protein